MPLLDLLASTSAGEAEGVTVRGAVGDGVADDTSSIQAQITAAAGGVLRFTPGKSFAVGNLTVPANTTLIGWGAKILANASGTMLSVGSGGKVVGLEVDGASLATAGVAASGATDIQVDACYIHDVMGQAINLVTTYRASVRGCRIQDCSHGIQWWGGDAASSNAVATGDLTITGNVVQNVSGGGIWGSLGERVSVVANVVNGSGDVGIDFEGSRHSSAVGNCVTNCTVAGISVYYGCTNLTITGNTVQQSVGLGPCFGALATETSTDIAVHGNILVHADGYCLSTDAAAISDSSIVSNQMTTAGTVARLLEADRMHVSSNRMVTSSDDTGLMVEGGSDCLISDNTIVASADASVTGWAKGGICLYWRSAGFPAVRNTVRGNTVRGFVDGIVDDCWGSATSHNWIVDNRTSSINNRFDTASGYAGVIEGNRSTTSPSTVVGDASTSP